MPSTYRFGDLLRPGSEVARDDSATAQHSDATQSDERQALVVVSTQARQSAPDEGYRQAIGACDHYPDAMASVNSGGRAN